MVTCPGQGNSSGPLRAEGLWPGFMLSSCSFWAAITSMHGGEVVFGKLISAFKGSEKMERVLLSGTVLSRAVVLQ